MLDEIRQVAPTVARQLRYPRITATRIETYGLFGNKTREVQVETESDRVKLKETTFRIFEPVSWSRGNGNITDYEEVDTYEYYLQNDGTLYYLRRHLEDGVVDMRRYEEFRSTCSDKIALDDAFLAEFDWDVSMRHALSGNAWEQADTIHNGIWDEVCDMVWYEVVQKFEVKGQGLLAALRELAG